MQVQKIWMFFFFFTNPQLVADVEKEEKDNEDQCNPRGKKFYWLTNIS